MPSSIHIYTQLTLCVLLLSLSRASRAAASVADLTTELSLHLDELDWHTSSMYDDGIDEIGSENDGDGDEDGDDFSSTSVVRRSMLWQWKRYYISYGALSANRVPCPPRSGRSYYTHDCWRARGPVRPYTRGCSAITRCRR